MKRLDRLTALLTLLQSRRYVTSDLIRERYAVSQRTVYRDIASLQEADIPIGYEPNRGYFLPDGYSLPPVHFTNEEAMTLILAEHLMNKFTDSDTQKKFGEALAKVRAVLRSTQKSTLESFEEKVRTYMPPAEGKWTDLLSRATEAISNTRLVRMSYTNFAGKASEREIEPIGLTFYSNQWHLIAYCRLRKDYRDFRLDRATSFYITDVEFPAAERQSLDEYIAEIQKHIPEEYKMQL